MINEYRIYSKIYQFLKILLDKLFNIAVNQLSKATRKDINTGIVIAGFGENEFLPSITSFTVDGIADVKLNIFGKLAMSVNNSFPSIIMPYAQSDMVSLFIRGVDNLYLNEQKTKLSKLISDYAEKMVGVVGLTDTNAVKNLKNQILSIGTGLENNYNQNMEAFIQKQFVSSIASVVSILQKDQPALLAESLITLTCQKRQFSTEEETVKPPVDVAVISEGDGFIWIQRKHYFKADLNPQYFHRQYGR